MLNFIAWIFLAVIGNPLLLGKSNRRTEKRKARFGLGVPRNAWQKRKALERALVAPCRILRRAAIVRGMSAKTDANKEDTAEKRARALELRHDGHSYERIGQTLGKEFHNQKGGDTFTAVYAQKLVLDGIKTIYRDKAEDLVKLEMGRLDDMQLEVLEVLRATHVVISSGAVVRDFVRNEAGEIVQDMATGLPATTPIVDHGPVLAAVDRLIKIQERRARLLGLDKPTKVSATDPDGKKAAPPWVIVASKEDQTL